MEYLNFDVGIGSAAGAYPVSVLRSPAGEPRGELRLPYSGLELQNRLQAIEIAVLKSSGGRRRILAPDDRAVQEFGQALFDTLISGDVRSSFDVSRSLALREGRGLRLRLRIEPPELAVLPWEFLYDSRQGEFLCLSVFTPVVRYLELPGSITPVELAPPLRILAMAATPEDQAPLNVERERRRVTAALSPLEAEGKVEVTWLEGQTWRALQRAMRGGPWHIFHFVGHGRFDPERDEGFIELADESGRSAPLTATQLGRLLADHPTLRMVQLNACEGARGSAQDIFSGTASILVRRGIPAVLAMQYEISDPAAVEFSRSFYEALAEGLPVDAACAEARKAISLSRPMSLEWGTPVLCMRTPDGALFSVQSGGSGRPGLGAMRAPADRAAAPAAHGSGATAAPMFGAQEPGSAPAPTRERTPTRSAAGHRVAPAIAAGGARGRRPTRGPRVWIALALVAVLAAAAGALALFRPSTDRPNPASATGGESIGTSRPSGSGPSPTGSAAALPELQALFRHRSGFPFDFRYPSSWGEQRLESSNDFGEFAWVSPIPGLFEPSALFSDPMRQALVADPGRVIGAVVPDLQYAYDRATFEQNLQLSPDHEILRSQIRVDEAQNITADRVEGVTVDPGGSGLSLRVIAYGYELTPDSGGVWSVIAFVASEEAFAGDAAGGALFDAIAATISFDEEEISTLRS